MQIFIKTLTGNTITLDCDSLEGLKRQISEREGMDIDRQRLNYGGKELDAESLSDGITVHLSSRMMGGKDDPLQKYIALIVLSVIIGIFFVIWPTFYLIYKNWGNIWSGTQTNISAIGTGFFATASAIKTGVGVAATAVGTGASRAATAIGTGAVATGKAIGTGAVATGKSIGTGAVATGKAIGTGAVATGKAIGTGVVATGKSIGTGVGVTASAVGTGAKEYGTHITKNAMNLPISISIATGLGVGMYYGLRDLPPTEIAILSPFILVLLFPLIMRYVYKFENWHVEPTNILFILGLIIFGIYSTFKNGDEFSRAIVLNSSIILTLSYIAQRYYTEFTDNVNYKKVSAIDALKNSLLLTGASAVFLVSIL
jgi:hypothetical protein